MNVGDGNGEPEESSSCEEDSNSERNHHHSDSDKDDEKELAAEIMMGQKIFFTDGGRTNKVSLISFYKIKQSSKKLLEQRTLKKRSKEESEIRKQSKCIIM